MSRSILLDAEELIHENARSFSYTIKAFSLIREPIVVLPVTRSIASMGVDFIPPVISRNAWLCAFSSGLRVTSVAVMSGSQQYNIIG
ncbi:unnamed protein product [Rodentolepis nana]|uniref:FMN hydroxy acid dehydrogenase domain-containing protein n=1 Tax=Rodentolepis nana TaxID=102285 RepID=A0A0R3T8C9_RODNA|nr:unnamed protein product [Rodentolepis nana]